MQTLWMFFPENDVALANGSSRFTAPKNAEQLRRDCSFLLNWVAVPGDSVVYEPIDADWEATTQAAHFPQVSRFDGTPAARFDRVMPWGWSAAVKHRLLKMGVPGHLLPGDDRIARIRELSHRRSSIEINRRLRDAGIPTPPLPVEVFSVEQLVRATADGRWMVKSPWSSSGRGVVDTATISRAELLRRGEGLLRHQGSLLVEPYLDNRRDFAMLFEVGKTGAKFAGFSIFENANGTAYSGNLVAPNSELLRRLSAYVSEDDIMRIVNELQKILSAMLERVYEGYCGVDMMIYRTASGDLSIAPCVELNLRMTMGVVAMLIASRHPELGEADNPEILTTRHPEFSAQIMKMSPDVDAISLTPPSARFRFRLSREID